MYDCYLSQFECMKRILDGKERLLDGFPSFYRSVNPDRVYLMGSGTSYNACSAAAAFMEKCLGTEVLAVAPTCVGNVYGKRPLAIAVSQSGRSTNTVSALGKMRASGAAVITLTDPIHTPVGDAGDFSMRLDAGQELVGPKTRGYMATVLTLCLMALEAGFMSGGIDKAFHDSAVAAFSETAARGGKYFEACQKFYDANLEDLKKARHFLFVGKGVAAKVAQEDALKVLETLCYPSSGYEYEEFLHGPACCTDEGLACFFFLSGDEDRARMLQTAKIIREATPNCYIVSHSPEIGGEKTLYLATPDPWACSPFTDILFGQLISARLTEELGRTRHPAVKDIFARMNTKVPVGTESS
jgi:glucoselysine-6-phosphate deglycase